MIPCRHPHLVAVRTVGVPSGIEGLKCLTCSKTWTHREWMQFCEAEAERGETGPLADDGYDDNPSPEHSMNTRRMMGK